MKKLLLICLILASAGSSFAQKKKRILIESADQVITEAVKELDEEVQGPEGKIYIFMQEYSITGKFTFDITIHEKGYVATVFVVENDGGSIQSQNRLKDFIKDYRFWFKTPKGKDYKFQYVFNFN
ncbi:MAG: hypothetical protein KDC05_05620 [Bacteroidales bacterium]|nr:hypothetical protein [Bacteroidales bacterium]